MSETPRISKGQAQELLSFLALGYSISRSCSQPRTKRTVSLSKCSLGSVDLKLVWEVALPQPALSQPANARTKHRPSESARSLGDSTRHLWRRAHCHEGGRTKRYMHVLENTYHRNRTERARERSGGGRGGAGGKHGRLASSQSILAAFPIVYIHNKARRATLLDAAHEVNPELRAAVAQERSPSTLWALGVQASPSQQSEKTKAP